MENLWYIVPIVIFGSMFCTAIFLGIRAYYINKLPRKAGIREARRAEKRRVARIRRLEWEQLWGCEILSLLNRDLKNSPSQWLFKITGEWNGDKEIFAIDIQPQVANLPASKIFVYFTQRQPVVITDGQKRFCFFLEDGKKFIKNGFSPNLFKTKP